MRASAPAARWAERARPEWLPEAVALADSVFRPAGPGSMASDYPLLFDPANAENLFVHREGGCIVGLVGSLPCDLVIDGRPVRAASIGSVATAPTLRGRGIASALLDLAERELRAGGCRLLLISGQRELYRRFGAVRVGSVRWYRVERPLASGRGLAISPLASEHLSDVARLYDRRRTRYVRTLAALERLFAAAGFAAAEQAEQAGFVASDDAEARAYAVVVRGARHYAGAALVSEWAGDADALVEIFDAVFRMTSGGLLVPLLEDGPELAQRLPGSAALAPEPCPYTVKVIAGVGLWDDLGRPAGVRLAETRRGVYALEDDGGLRTLGAPELTSLLFGQPQSDVPRPPALEEICPLPFVWPQGLNYV